MIHQWKNASQKIVIFFGVIDACMYTVLTDPDYFTTNFNTIMLRI